MPAEIRLYNQLFAKPDPDAGNFAADLNPNSLEVLEGALVEPALVAVGKGTGGAVRLRDEPDACQRILGRLVEGAFAGSEPRDSYFVICDERVNRPNTIAEGRISVLFGFATTRPAESRLPRRRSS